MNLCAKPLKDYGDFSWYDAPLQSMPNNFTLVVCDGPPGNTKGGRFGLVPIIMERLEPGSIILLDDAEREQERAIARRWVAELDASFETLGRNKPYIKMTVMGRQQQEATASPGAAPIAIPLRSIAAGELGR